MKVISTPDYSNWTHEITCPDCQSKLEACESDLKYEYYSGDMREPSSETFYVTCPVCDRGLGINVSNIPHVIKVRLRKKNGR